MIKILDNPNELLKEMELKELKQEHDRHLIMFQNVEKDNNVLLFSSLGRDMFKDNTYILNKYFKNEDGQDCYYANLLYFNKRFPEMKLDDVKDILKLDFRKSVNLTGYKYNPEHYRFATQCMQDEYEEDLFKTNKDEVLEFEADRRKRIEPLDFGALETLYLVLHKALRQRYIMLFNLETVPGILNNALGCYFLGVNCGPSNEAMYAKIAEIRQILENPTVIEWLKTGATDMSFDREDYVETYQKVLRSLSDVRAEDLEEYREAIHNEYDLFEDEILSNNCIDACSYVENVSYTEIEEDSDDYLD